MIAEAELSGAHAGRAHRLLAPRTRRRWQGMAAQSARLGKPDAARRIVDDCCGPHRPAHGPTGQRASGLTTAMYRKTLSHPLRGHRRHRHERHRRAAAQPRATRSPARTSRPRRSPRASQGLGGVIFEGHAADRIQGADVVVDLLGRAARQPRGRGRPALVDPGDPARRDAGRADASASTASPWPAPTARPRPPPSWPRCWRSGGLDPTVVIGGKLIGIGTNAVLGRGDFIVAEADESDGSFLRYAPAIAVVTNIDREHLDFYPDLAAHPARLPRVHRPHPVLRPGRAVPGQRAHPGPDPPHPEAAHHLRHDARRPTSRSATWRSRAAARASACFATAQALGRFTLNLPGVHNVYNATASIVAGGVELDIPVARIQAALENVRGCAAPPGGQGRGERRHRGGRLRPPPHRDQDDARRGQARCWPERRVVVVFQPHRYTPHPRPARRVRPGLLPVRRAVRARRSTPPARTASRASPARRLCEADQGARPQAGASAPRASPPPWPTCARRSGAGGPAADAGRRRCLEGRRRGVAGVQDGAPQSTWRCTGAAA
ncbi:MAG: hypothetical protein MZV70_20230 [Desulfobacterales bacterium]|nr:hypothetical protein [Desulfobacterales bacterium]